MTDEGREPGSLEEARLEKLARIEALGIDPWGRRFDGHQAIAAVRALPAAPNGSPTPGPKVRVAGRIMLKRGQGKVLFLELRDWTERVQVMIGKSQVGETGWSLAGELDLGDLLGVDGKLGHTKTGELTVFAESLTFLGKSLATPPEKWHGLTDVELRSRKRYADLFSNPDSLRNFLGRAKIVAGLRRRASGARLRRSRDAGLQAIAGGAAARPFVTHHNALDIDLFMRIAPELYLKRLLVGGMERVFELGRVFRNEGISRKHNPEFTMLEAYQAYSDYQGMIDLTQSLFVAAIEALDGEFKRLGEMRSSISRLLGLSIATRTCSRSMRMFLSKMLTAFAPRRRLWGSKPREKLTRFWWARYSRNASSRTLTVRFSSSTIPPRSVL